MRNIEITVKVEVKNLDTYEILALAKQEKIGDFSYHDIIMSVIEDTVSVRERAHQIIDERAKREEKNV